MFRGFGSQKEEVAVVKRGEGAVCDCVFCFVGCFLFFLALRGRMGDTWKGKEAAVTEMQSAIRGWQRGDGGREDWSE